jgi:transcriptional regulator with XRE-family HTH domain
METPLKRILDEEGRRQSWLAQRLGKDGSTVWNWVHGITMPDAETQQAVADLLGRPREQLWPDEDPH